MNPIEYEAYKLKRAIWAGDVAYLERVASCVCCCGEHTFEGCPARQWYGCRGQESMTRADETAWQRHYADYHGMSADQFYGLVG